MTRYQGVVEIEYRHFTLAHPETDTTSVTTRSHLVDLGAGFVTVHTGIANGPVLLSVDLVERRPESNIARWDLVTECSIDVQFPLSVITATGNVPDDFAEMSHISAGTYGLRVHCQRQAENADATTDTVSEKYLLTFWPSPLFPLLQVKSTEASETGSPAESAPADPPLHVGTADATVQLRGPVIMPER